MTNRKSEVDGLYDRGVEQLNLDPPSAMFRAVGIVLANAIDELRFEIESYDAGWTIERRSR